MSSESEVRLDLELWRESSSLVFDFDVSSVLVSESRCLLHAPLTPDLRNEAGAPVLGMLVSLLDVAAAEPALVTCRPDWTATQNLSLHATQAAWRDGPVVIDVQLLRAGKKSITMAARVHDAGGETDFTLLQRAIDDGSAACTARGLVSFVRLPRASASGMESYEPWNWIGKVRRRTYKKPPSGNLLARMGARILDADQGVLELPRTPYVSNAIGTIFGGAQASLLQLAAEAMRPGRVATDIELHYLSQLRVGPARTRGTVLRDAPDHNVISLELTDAGYGDHVLALATVTLQRPA
ncbi:MAG: acyl-CoA thioesterase domain-containing protein [Polyangiales bacterium]